MKYNNGSINIDDAYNYFLSTLSNKNRIKILNQLLNGEKNVSQLTKSIGIDQSTVSNNLKRLKSCGFVLAKPNGKERIYELNKETIKPLMKIINKHILKYFKECVKNERKKNKK